MKIKSIIVLLGFGILSTILYVFYNPVKKTRNNPKHYFFSSITIDGTPEEYLNRYFCPIKKQILRLYCDSLNRSQSFSSLRCTFGSETKESHYSLFIKLTGDSQDQDRRSLFKSWFLRDDTPDEIKNSYFEMIDSPGRFGFILKETSTDSAFCLIPYSVLNNLLIKFSEEKK